MPLFKKPRYSTVRGVSSRSKKEIPEGLWIKCSKCEAVLLKEDLQSALKVCLECDHHHPLSCWERLALITDEGSFNELHAGLQSVDILKFTGTASYEEKLVQNRQKTDLNDAVICGEATLDRQRLALAIMDFRFLGASMGSVVGEKIARITEYATAERLPLVIVTASGGARMYEGMFSLMQMAKTSGALAAHAAAELPYIAVLTHPTTAGVTASFASLGDIIVAEPGALIGFAGPRVIKQTTQATLPEGFQTAEFLLEKGFIDRIIPRKDLRRELSLLLAYVGA